MNFFGYISLMMVVYVCDSFGGKIVYILEGGDVEIGLELMIVDLCDLKKLVVLWLGVILVV